MQGFHSFLWHHSLICLVKTGFKSLQRHVHVPCSRQMGATTWVMPSAKSPAYAGPTSQED